MRLFLFNLPSLSIDSSEYALLLSHLDKDDQARVKRFRLPEDSLSIQGSRLYIGCLVGRLALLWYLRQESLLPDHTSLKVDRKGKGKPILVEPRLDPPMAFNTSHDGCYVLFGVSRGYGSNIGVDIMEYPKDAWEVQEGISEQDERDILALPMNEEERARLITRIWTFKEAYVKAIGEGIAFGLERIWLDLKADGEVHAIHVDGQDVKVDGWEWACGTVESQEGGRPYGYAMFWKKDPWLDGLELVSWKDFIELFSSQQSADNAWQRIGR